MRIVRRVALALAALCFVAPVAFAVDDGPSGARVGSELPAISGVDLSEKPVDLKSLIGRKTIVLSFWSIYCSDCVREMDDLRSIRAEFPVEEVEVVAINTDSAFPVSRIASFVRRYEGARGAPLDVVHIVDRNEAIVKALGVRFIPLMITINKAGTVASVMGGYDRDQDKSRLYQALEQGSVSLGAWSEGLRGRLRSILRGSGPDGLPVEWGSFRVEEGMSLFGLYDNSGWRADVLGRSDHEAEVARVERVVRDRLRLSLMKDALGSIGIRVADDRESPFQARGITIPESPMDNTNRWRRLYQDLSFSDFFRVESNTGKWVGDEFWGVLVGDVELGRLRARLKELEFPSEPVGVKLTIVSDSDFKPRILLKSLRERSYRVHSFQGDSVQYYGTPEMALAEIKEITIPGMAIFAEREEGGSIRIEVF
jgi:thiol-disulfide isomerase/thioredoxin